MSTDIVYFTDTSFVNDKVNSLAVVFNIKPVTDIKTFTIYRKWLIIKSIGNHKRNKLFWEVVWSVVVRTSAYSYRKSISSVVS